MYKFMKRIWHEIVGHPGKEIEWGNAEQGAKCSCGTTFHLWDLYP